jgi:hypothetical protein
MPRYVVLEHVGHGTRHWDLMLETGAALATWALERPPDSGSAVSAGALPDHRIAYLDYEGPISGDRGSVTHWDAGEYQLLTRDENELTASLSGGKLVGRMTLVRSADASERWTFNFTPE